METLTSKGYYLSLSLANLPELARVLQVPKIHSLETQGAQVSELNPASELQGCHSLSCV